MSPQISVIITCYNLEQYIGPAIESVLAQDVAEPFEVLVVDDCSDDGSEAIIKSYPGVRYFKTELNSGVLLAMLDGFQHTSGDLVFLLDGDDLWESSKLAIAVEAFRADPNCAFTTHDLVFVDEINRPIVKASRPAEVLTGLEPGACSSRIIEGILHHLDYVWLGSALGIRRTLADLHGFDRWARQLPDPTNTYQDWPLAFWVASKPGIRAAYSPDKLFRYRLHGANYSGDSRDTRRVLRNLGRAKRTIEAMLELANSRGLPAKICTSLQRRALSYTYLIDLYSMRRIAALAGYVRAMPDFLPRGEARREILRMAAIMLLGPDRFTRIASRKRTNKLG
jgi:glycosyltransferase involved in cell wall biosynthesis